MWGASETDSSAASMFSSSVSMAIRGGRSVLSTVSIRRNQVVSMDNAYAQETELRELDIFQTRIAMRLLTLEDSPEEDDDAGETVESAAEKNNNKNKTKNKKKERKRAGKYVLSLAFLTQLMDFFLFCDEEFRGLLALFNSAVVSKAEHAVSDHLDRSIKSLDICNAVTSSLDSLRYSKNHAAIVVDALLAHRPVGEGHLIRSKTALAKLLAAISERPAERAWSFGRTSTRWSTTTTTTTTAATSTAPRCGHRALSLAVSKTWSASKQLQAMTANLQPPRGGEASAFALAVHTMSSIQVFVMWVLVAAFPSQERSPAPAFPAPPRQLPWAATMTALMEKIMDEWKKKEKKGLMPSGMMAELQELDRCGKKLLELGEASGTAEMFTDVANEMADVCRTMEEELHALQRKVREVFHRIARTRSEMVDFARTSSA